MLSTNNCVVYVRASDIYNDSRAIKEIKALAEINYKVYVLGWNKSGDALEKVKASLKNKDYNIQYLFYNQKEGSGFAKKVTGRIKWGIWVNKSVSKIKKKLPILAIHACDLDSGLPLKQFQNRKGIKFVYDVYDYYADSHDFNRFVSSVIKRIEDSIVSNSDLTIICTEERREQIKDATPKKVIVVYNSPEVADRIVNEIESDYAYCGALDNGRMIGNILLKYKENASMKFAFAGRGELEAETRQVAKESQNFKYYGSVTYEEVLDIEEKTKVLSAIYDPSVKNHKLCAPNKFYEALALGKPIIVCKGTGIDTVVQNNNIGIVIEYDADEFYKALRCLICDDQKCAEMGQRARKLYEEKYKWENSKRVLIDEYKFLFTI